MAEHSPWSRVQATHEQDLAHAAEWWRDSSNRNRLAVWLAIQDMGGPDDPIGEVVARMAQLGFETIAFAPCGHGGNDE